MRVAEIHVYPLKGARGIAQARADVLRGGLRHDRRFMLLDASGTFLTQRSHPTLALVTTEIRGDVLVLGVPAGGSAEVSLSPEGPRRTVRLWKDDIVVMDVGERAAALVSEHLGQTCSLVYMPDDVVRPVEAPYGVAGDRVGLADGYPVLLATRASLADLNRRLDVPVPMSRFRPNLVVEGGEPYEEDLHSHVHVGSVAFRMPKRCARCQVILVDQDTAAVGKEPLRTLATYRTENSKVHFAQNLIPDSPGSVAVGDEVRYSGRL